MSKMLVPTEDRALLNELIVFVDALSETPDSLDAWAEIWEFVNTHRNNLEEHPDV